MTRFEECFPPDIVRAVYARLEREDSNRRLSDHLEPADNNVISLNAYRKVRIEERNELL